MSPLSALTTLTFAAPVALVGLVILVPAAISFLVRRRREVIRVPSILLWHVAGSSSAKNRRFRNLKRVASLMACLVALAALAMAAAKPTRRDRGETVAIVIDTSASMDAGGRDSPLAQAKRFAAKLVAAGGSGDRYVILAAGASPIRVASLAAPGPSLDAAIDGLHAERGTADVEGAIELAGQLLAGRGRIVVLGDGGEGTGAGIFFAHGLPVSHRTFASPGRDNLGIASFVARAAPDAHGDDEREATIAVATSSDRPRRARVTLIAGKVDVAVRHLDVPALGEAEVRVRVASGNGTLTARVAPDDSLRDALATDDTATLSAVTLPPPRVLLVTNAVDAPSAFFAEKALAAAGIKEIVQVAQDLPGIVVKPSDLLVALGEGPTHRVDVPAIYLGTRTGALPFTGVHEIGDGSTRLRSLEARDPLLRGVALDGVTIERAMAVNASKGTRALVDLDGGTVMLAGGVARTAFVYFGIDPGKSDLVLRVAFPVLIANALQTLGGGSEVVLADTVARTDIQLKAAEAEGGHIEEPDVRGHLPIRLPWVFALCGALLLALEGWTFRKGWAS